MVQTRGQGQMGEDIKYRRESRRFLPCEWQCPFHGRDQDPRSLSKRETRVKDQKNKENQKKEDSLDLKQHSHSPKELNPRFKLNRHCA